MFQEEARHVGAIARPGLRQISPLRPLHKRRGLEYWLRALTLLRSECSKEEARRMLNTGLHDLSLRQDVGRSQGDESAALPINH